jgi:Spy/CpxP family protein refolding chaperone
MARHEKIFGTALVLLALLVAPRAAAQERRQRPRPGADRSELMRALNLTPEQRARIAEIRRETEEQVRLNNVRLRRARRALEESIYAESADESAVEARAREVAEAEAARVRARADAELKVRRVLKPEQLVAFRELRRRATLDQRRQRRGANSGALPPRPRRQIERNRRRLPRP